MPIHKDEQFEAIGNAQLSEGRRQMVPDGRFADEQAIAGLPVLQPLSHEQDDLARR